MSSLPLRRMNGLSEDGAEAGQEPSESSGDRGRTRGGQCWPFLYAGRGRWMAAIREGPSCGLSDCPSHGHTKLGRPGPLGLAGCLT